MSWIAETVEKTFQNYQRDYQAYCTSLDEKEEIGKRLREKEGELTEIQKKIAGLEKEIHTVQSQEIGSYDEEAGKIELASKERMEAIEERLKEKKAELEEWKNAELIRNAQDLENVLKNMLGEQAEEILNISDTDRTAMDYEKRRVDFTSFKDRQLMAFENQIAEEHLAGKKDINALTERRGEIVRKYEPSVNSWQEKIEAVKEKYRSSLSEAEAKYQESEWNYKLETDSLEQERRNAVSECEAEKKQKKADYNKINNEWNRKILLATAQKKPTAQMKRSQDANKNRYKQDISKLDSSLESQLRKIDNRLTVANDKWGKIINRDKEKYQAILDKQNQELTEPSEGLKAVCEERDRLTAQIDGQISARKQQEEQNVAGVRKEIASCEQRYREQIESLDREMQEYAMSGEICFDEKEEEANRPFRALADRIPAFENAVKLLSGLSGKEEEEKERERAALKMLEYDGLLTEASHASELTEKLPFWLTGKWIVLAGTAVLAAVVGCVLFFLTGLHPAAAIGLPAVVFAGICAGVLMDAGKRKKRYIRALVLASEFESFASIRQHSILMTRKEEYERLRKRGRQIYEKLIGPEEEKRRHAEKEEDIRDDYERGLQMAEAEAEEERNEALIQKNRELEECWENTTGAENRRNRALEERNRNLMREELQEEKLSGIIAELREKLEDLERFISECEEAYEELVKKMQTMSADMEETHGKLNGKLYIVPDADVPMKGKIKPVYCISHNGKPLVVTYDTYGLESAEDYNKALGGLIEHCLTDLLLGVRLLNSRETYKQYIVDNVTGGVRFQQSAVRNDLSIEAVCRGTEELRDHLNRFEQQRTLLAAHGDSMGELNERLYQKQARPESYKIVYLVMRPEAEAGKLDEKIERLLPECDRFGFLPIFLCSREAWDKGIQQDKSIYKTIQKSTGNAVILYHDGIYG